MTQAFYFVAIQPEIVILVDENGEYYGDPTTLTIHFLPEDDKEHRIAPTQTQINYAEIRSRADRFADGLSKVSSFVQHKVQEAVNECLDLATRLTTESPHESPAKIHKACFGTQEDLNEMYSNEVMAGMEKWAAAQGYEVKVTSGFCNEISLKRAARAKRGQSYEMPVPLPLNISINPKLPKPSSSMSTVSTENNGQSIAVETNAHQFTPLDGASTPFSPKSQDYRPWMTPPPCMLNSYASPFLQTDNTHSPKAPHHETSGSSELMKFPAPVGFSKSNMLAMIEFGQRYPSLKMEIGSKKYQGSHLSNTSLQTIEDLPDDENTSLFLVGFPIGVTAAHILNLRNVKKGTIRAIHMYPAINGHLTQAAKIVFTTAAAASDLMYSGNIWMNDDKVHSSFWLYDSKINVSYNKYGVTAFKGTQTRVLEIEGPKEIMSFARWDNFFSLVCLFQYEYYGYMSCDNPQNAKMQFRFLRIDGQAQTCMQAIKKTPFFDGLVTVYYGSDPCNPNTRRWRY